MRTCVLLVALVLPLAGCAPSVNPIYTEKDLVYQPELAGKWNVENSKETWALSVSGDQSYEALYTDEKEGKYTFSIHLTRIGGRLFADLYPVDWELPGVENLNDFFLLHLAPVHNFVRVEIEGDRIRAWGMDVSWLQDYVEKHPFAPRHEERDDTILFTASTRKLRRFLKHQVKVKEAFPEDDQVVLLRAPAEAEAAQGAACPAAPDTTCQQ